MLFFKINLSQMIGYFKTLSYISFNKRFGSYEFFFIKTIRDLITANTIYVYFFLKLILRI